MTHDDRTSRVLNARPLTSALCALGLSLSAPACGDRISDEVGDPSERTTEERVAPVVQATSHALVRVGQTLEFFGEGFLKARQGSSQLQFEGTFTDQLGRATSVDLKVTPLFGGQEVNGVGRKILTWSRVGPFKNPFTRDERNGVFRGTVRVINTYTDGMIDEGPRVAMNLELAPSIIIERFEPIHADCGAPALRVFPGIPYRMKVKVGGLGATRFVYEFNQINGAEGVTTFDHDLGAGRVTTDDEVGASSEIVVFNPIPDDLQSYVTGVRVLAFDDEGNYTETALPVGVHRPVEVVYDGTYELAERYEPVPVSGCIPGSVGNSVSYSESVSETRTQSVSMTLSTSWSNQTGRDLSTSMTEGISVGESSSRSLGTSSSEHERVSESTGETYTESESNNVGYSSSDGESWSWNLSEGESQEEYERRMGSMYGQASGSVSVGVSGEGSVPGFAKVSGSVETSVGVTAGTSTGTTTGASTRTSTQRGHSMAGSSRTSESFGSALSESSSTSIDGTYVIGNSSSSSSSTSEGMSRGRTWNLSESSSVSESVSEDNSESLSEATVTSASSSVSQSLSGVIPRGRFGIFYRQTTRWVRRAEVRSFDLCGVASHMGELQFNEWDWAPDLAIGDECGAVPPPSTMPSARCFIQPCGE